MRVKCFAQEHNTMTRPGLEPGPLNLESSVLTTRTPRLPLDSYESTALNYYTVLQKIPVEIHCMLYSNLELYIS